MSKTLQFNMIFYKDFKILTSFLTLRKEDLGNTLNTIEYALKKNTP